MDPSIAQQNNLKLRNNNTQGTAIANHIGVGQLSELTETASHKYPPLNFSTICT